MSDFNPRSGIRVKVRDLRADGVRHLLELEAADVNQDAPAGEQAFMKW
jgi:hypothetical protein